MAKTVKRYVAQVVISFKRKGDDEETHWMPGDAIAPDDFDIVGWESLLQQGAVAEVSNG